MKIDYQLYIMKIDYQLYIMKIDYQHVVYDEKCLSVERYEYVLYVIHLQQHRNDLCR